MNLKLGIKWNVNKKLTEKQAEKVLFNCMLKLHELATINAPVDTGRLKNSIDIFPTSPGYKEYLLFTPVEYAEANEFGTFKMSAHPFFRPALIQVKNVWVKRYWDNEFSK